MNIHRQNIQKMASGMQAWTQKHLNPLGIYECNYNYFDLKTGAFMPIPMDYHWYCQYVEKGHHMNALHRLERGTGFWQQDSPLFQAYRKHMNIENCYKLDLITKTETGYELMVVAGAKPLHLQHSKKLSLAFQQLKTTAAELRTENPHLVTCSPILLETMS